MFRNIFKRQSGWKVIDLLSPVHKVIDRGTNYDALYKAYQAEVDRGEYQIVEDD